MTWVEVTSFDGLGQPKSTALSGATWSTALMPLALVVLAAAVAALAVRGWVLRLVGVLVAVATVRDGLPGDRAVGHPRRRRSGGRPRTDAR